MIYIISDLHFNHGNVIKYSDRPFADIAVMHAKLVENWNLKVSKDDTVYFLGDFSFGRHTTENDIALVMELNGHKKMILGNHDFHFNVYGEDGKKRFAVNNTLDAKKYWTNVGFEEVFSHPIVLDDYFILSHHPINGLNHNQIFANIHGHTHNINMENGNYFNACVENTNYEPIAFEKIKEHFNEN